MSKHAFVLLLVTCLLGSCRCSPDSMALQGSKSPQAVKLQSLATAADRPSTILAGQGDAADTIAYSGDSIQYLARTNFQLLSYLITADTLQLTSTSPFLYYPLGNYARLAAFKKIYPTFVFKQETDAFDASAVLYRATTTNGFVKLFRDDEKNTLEIVSGEIAVPEISLANGIAVGMTKRDFFKLLLKKPSIIEKSGLRVVEFISGLDGIRHYYIFQDERLTQIKFDTTYQFSKR